MNVPRRLQQQVVRTLRHSSCIQSIIASQLHSTHSPSTTLIMMEYAAATELVRMQLLSMESPPLLVDSSRRAKPKHLELAV